MSHNNAKTAEEEQPIHTVTTEVGTNLEAAMSRASLGSFEMVPSASDTSIPSEPSYSSLSESAFNSPGSSGSAHGATPLSDSAQGTTPFSDSTPSTPPPSANTPIPAPYHTSGITAPPPSENAPDTPGSGENAPSTPPPVGAIGPATPPPSATVGSATPPSATVGPTTSTSPPLTAVGPVTPPPNAYAARATRRIPSQTSQRTQSSPGGSSAADSPSVNNPFPYSLDMSSPELDGDGDEDSDSVGEAVAVAVAVETGVPGMPPVSEQEEEEPVAPPVADGDERPVPPPAEDPNGITIAIAPPTPPSKPVAPLTPPAGSVDEITIAPPFPPRAVLPYETRRIRGLCRMRILYAAKVPHFQPTLAHALLRWCTEIEIAEIVNMGPVGNLLTQEHLDWLGKEFESITGKSLDNATDRKPCKVAEPLWWWKWNRWWEPVGPVDKDNCFDRGVKSATSLDGLNVRPKTGDE